MVVALASDLGADWFGRISNALAQHAMVLPTDAAGAPDLAHRLPVSILIVNADPLITNRLLSYQQLVHDLPEAVMICLSTLESKDQIRQERLLAPDFWLSPTAELDDLEETLRLAMHKAHLLSHNSKISLPSSEAGLLPGPPERLSPEEGVLRQLLAAMAGSTDANRLLQAYVDAAVQLVRCANHCFLWRRDGAEMLRVKCSMGLPPQLAAHGRLAPADSLIAWYRNNCRALTRLELGRWPDLTAASALARELDVFRGQVAIPLVLQGRLDGLLILGEKVIGDAYSQAELETLFVLTGYVALHLENLQLQEQVQDAQAYMERSLTGMRCGLITLGRDQRLAVCNPYAASLLGTTVEQLEGADLRALPSPLGDYLYAAFRSPEGAVTAENVELLNRQLHVRVTTSTLLDQQNEPMGSVLLLEDITGPIELAAETSRQDTINVLTRIIGRIAHEVRTPLTAIKTYAQLMDTPADDQDDLVRFWRETVSPELDRLDQLITEQVRLVEQPQPEFQLVNVEQLVRQALAALGEDSEGHLSMPLLKVVPPVPQVVADPGPARDAISYLLRYLRDHADTPVAVVLDQVKKGPLPDVRLRMRTSVNGRTFDPATILDPLAVLQTEEGDLGPAIGGQLMDKMGGRVEARNGDGYFEFRVLFPVNVVESHSLIKGEADV
ncbi:MAG: histidine kinase dimerization/phospho-acceptor domain-containing protein [Armatimonadota bacterium]